MNLKMQLEEMEKMMDANIEDRERVISQRNGQIMDLKREKEELEAALYGEKEERGNDASERNAKFKEEKVRNREERSDEIINATLLALRTF